MHIQSEPAILYFGTPVVLVSTVNENGSYNLAPMSSAWWLAWRCVLGFGSHSKTPQNMIRTGECVLNLPSADMVGAVNRLALTTGSNPVPPSKAARGYRYEPEKFAVAGLTPRKSETVSAPRVLECRFNWRRRSNQFTTWRNRMRGGAAGWYRSKCASAVYTCPKESWLMAIRTASTLTNGGH